MGNIYKGVAKAILNKNPIAGEYPTLEEEGARGMLFIEKVVESHSSGNTWVSL